MDTTDVTWEALLEQWWMSGKISQEDYDAMTNLISDVIWERERYGYTLGRAYRGRMAHGDAATSLGPGV